MAHGDGPLAGAAAPEPFDRIRPALHEPADHTEGRWRLRLRAADSGTHPGAGKVELVEEMVLDARKVLDPEALVNDERQVQRLSLEELRWLHQQSGELLAQLEPPRAAHRGTTASISIVPGHRCPRHDDAATIHLERVVITEQGTEGGLPVVDFLGRNGLTGEPTVLALTGRIVNGISAAVKGVNTRIHGIAEP
jgi:hypothetical protein